MVQDGVGKCVCPAICPAIYLPVCGSDEKIYDNDCELRVASCTEQKKIVVASKEKCSKFMPLRFTQVPMLMGHYFLVMNLFNPVTPMV